MHGGPKVHNCAVLNVVRMKAVRPDSVMIPHRRRKKSWAKQGLKNAVNATKHDDASRQYKIVVESPEVDGESGFNPDTSKQDNTQG